MSICDDLSNITIAIERPRRRGSGGAEIGAPLSIVTALPAVFEPSHTLFKDAVGGRDVLIRAKFAIDGTHPTTGAVLNIQTGDIIKYADPLTGAALEEEIDFVDPWLDGADLSHVELLVGSGGAGG